MSDSPFSNAWYRVSGLRPRLSGAASVSRHRYRGESWYVVRDAASGRVHRFTPQTYLLIGRMDGHHTLDEIWSFALERLGDDAPSQDELIELLGQLHAGDLVQCDVTPDSAELLERHDKTERSRKLSRIASPLFIRIPLWDPDAFLRRWLPAVRWMWHWPGAVLWLLLVPPALVLAGMHWDELTDNLSDRVLSAGNLLLLWLTFPVVKLLHELGHAFATRARGGEVHEIGVMLLVLTPIPYIDSSAANAFRSRRDRALVGAAGMLVETALAALAMFVWVLLEPGLARAICFNVMLIAGVSTVLFNLNPLLKFDGYFILCDWLEMPNLAKRSQRLWVDGIDRRLFGSDRVQPARLGPGERGWLVAYTPLAATYRLFVMVSIALFVATKFFVVGVLMAVWALAQGLVWPLLKGVWHLLDAPVLAARRGRAIVVSAAALGVAALVLFALPAPHRAMVQGVVWVPDDAQLRVQTAGFVSALHVAPGAAVGVDTVVAFTEDRQLDAQIAAQSARVDEAQARWDSLRFNDRAQAELARQALEAEQAALDRLHEDLAQRRVAARTPGTVVVPRAEDLPGRYLRKGDLLGYVAQPEHRLVRVVVPQEEVEPLRGGVRAVDVRLAPTLDRVLQARIVREVPAGSQVLPSRALAIEGGGTIALDPRDGEGRRALNRFFQFDIELLGELPPAPLGARAYVRLDLPPEPLGWQAWRAVRQLFLARLDV